MTKIDLNLLDLDDPVGDHARSLSQEDYARKHLKDLRFSDIYISESGQAFIKSNSPTGNDLTASPASVMEDIRALYDELCSRGQYEDEFFIDHSDLRFRVSKLRDVSDVWYVCRKLMWPLPALADLPGIDTMVIRQLSILGHPSKKGLILIGGATGSGKTNTLFTLLKAYLHTYGDVAVCIEDPPELPMSGFYKSKNSYSRVFQVAVKGGDFAREMKRVMRFAPRYIIIGEIRSPAEAVTAVHASLNGHLVLSTIHGSSVTSSMAALIDYASESVGSNLAKSLLSQGLLGVIHQELRDSDSNGLRALNLKYLFLGSDVKSTADRAKIHEGNFKHLENSIETQAINVSRARLPLADLQHSPL